MRVIVAPRFIAPVIDKLALWFPARTDEFIELMKRCDNGLKIELKPVFHKRSLEQNNRYWKIVTALGKEVGLPKGAMHDEILCEYHGYDIVMFRGEAKKVPLSRSSNMKTKEFSELMDIAERWAAEMGVYWDDNGYLGIEWKTGTGENFSDIPGAQEKEQS